mgnify:CR=1 FL=1
MDEADPYIPWVAFSQDVFELNTRQLGNIGMVLRVSCVAPTGNVKMIYKHFDFGSLMRLE